MENISVIEAIVNTLLQVGECVVEVSRDLQILRIWNREGSGLNLPDKKYVGSCIDDVGFLKHDLGKIDETFRSHQSKVLELVIAGERFVGRTITNPCSGDTIFLVIEHIAGRAEHNVSVHEADAAYCCETAEELQRLYDRILNNIYADIVVLDESYKFVYVSPAAVQDMETRQWLIGKTDEEFFVYRKKPLTLAKRRWNMYEAARNERRMIEWVERTETAWGSIKSVLRKIYPVFDSKGNLEIIIGYSMNVTELVTAQDDLKTSRDTFQRAFHDSGIGMALLSPEGNWLDANRVICDLLGYNKEELMQKNHRDISYPGEWEKDRPLVKKMLHREISSYTEERKYIARNGKVISVLLTMSLVWSKDDVPQFFIAQAVDITPRKELENEISSKNVELESTKQTLINKVSQLEELSYVIAHNLRGPAGNIKVLSETLLDDLAAPAGENPPSGFTMQEGLGYIHNASTGLISSLASLMQIAAIKLNKDIEKEECEVARVVEEVAVQLRSAILEKKATLSLSLEEPVVYYPRPYLESILYNFISNSLKYSKPGVPPEILIATRNTASGVQLAIKDNGLGIDMDRYGDRIFKLSQVFHSGHDSKGFGLYLTKTQVEALGGSISVDSKLNEGSEFVVTI